MLDKLKGIHGHFLDLQEKLSDPETVSDMKKFMKINKEYKSLEEINNAYLEYSNVLENISSSEEMVKDEDEEMREMAKAELQILNKKREELEENIKVMLIPKDPEDSKNVVFEIRSGAGGDEASIFAGD